MCAGRQHYDVELVVTTFGAPLWETVRLVHGTDVFLGMHGAGFTNLLWLRQVRAASQGVLLRSVKWSPGLVPAVCERTECLRGSS